MTSQASGVQLERASLPGRRGASRLLRMALLLGAVCLSGCIRKETQGDLSVYSFERWVGGSVVVVGLAVAIGAILFRKSGAGAWVTAVVALVITTVAAPMLFSDHVKLDKEHLETRWGLWFAPSVHNVRFDDVVKVDYTKEVKRGRRGRKNTTYFLIFTKKSGEQDKVAVSGELMSAASDELAAALLAKGLDVNDLTGE